MLCKSRKLKPNDGFPRQSPSRLKAQSSIEFILIFGLLLTVLAVGATVGWLRIYGISEANKNLEISKVLDDITSKINLAFLGGDGFQINLNVPKDISGQNYSVNIYNNNVVIIFENLTYSKTLLTQNITGNLSIGINNLLNEEGEILIT